MQTLYQLSYSPIRRPLAGWSAHIDRGFGPIKGAGLAGVEVRFGCVKRRGIAGLAQW